jgi:hypothetical protein
LLILKSLLTLGWMEKQNPHTHFLNKIVHTN